MSAGVTRKCLGSTGSSRVAGGPAEEVEGYKHFAEAPMRTAVSFHVMIGESGFSEYSFLPDIEALRAHDA